MEFEWQYCLYTSDIKFPQILQLDETWPLQQTKKIIMMKSDQVFISRSEW